LVVGGIGERGVVCSASYEARAFGVRSAMPTGEARRLCPHAVYLAPRHDRYAELSRAIHAVLGDVTPLIEGLGLDEAFLDVSGSHRLFGSSGEIAVELRRRIASEPGLPCSVGVARSKLIAKLASKAAKPAVRPPATAPIGQSRRGVLVAPGVVVVHLGDELAFLHAHPVRALPGVGPRTEQRLGRFGVSSVGDLAAVPRESLERLLGAAHGSALHALARGLDTRGVAPERATRSIGHEETFASDLREPVELGRRARAMAAAVAERCREAGVEARTVTVKVRFADFSTHTRSRTLTHASAAPSVLGDAAAELLGAIDRATGARLLAQRAGVGSTAARAVRRRARRRPGGAPRARRGRRSGPCPLRRRLDQRSFCVVSACRAAR
jgi:DNA polymerase-4